MFPWNYGFHWGIASYLFLGAFYTVLLVVASTLVSAFWRARQTLHRGAGERVRWQSDFHDLPASDRVCRHVLTGELQRRECPHAFDCRECTTHAKLVMHHPAEPLNATTSDIFGMSFPADRFYHRGHTWAHPEPDGTVTIGLDDLAVRLLGTPDEVILPKPGATLCANGAAFRVRRREADVRIISPIDGEVIDTGGVDRAFLLRVRPANGKIDTRHLLSGAEVKPWMSREMERLQLVLSGEGASVPCLPDGGVPVRDIASAYPDMDWDIVCGAMFLEP